MGRRYICYTISIGRNIFTFKPVLSEKMLDFTASMNPKYYLDSPIISEHYNDLNLAMPYFGNLIYANGGGLFASVKLLDECYEFENARKISSHT